MLNLHRDVVRESIWANVKKWKDRCRHRKQNAVDQNYKQFVFWFETWRIMMQGRGWRLCSSVASFDDMHDLQVTSTSSKEQPWGHACRDLEKHSVMLEWPQGWNGSRHWGLFLSNGWLFGWVDWPDLAKQPWPGSTRGWQKMDVLHLLVYLQALQRVSCVKLPKADCFVSSH